VLTTGAIPFLKEHFPEARIDYLVRPPYADLLSEEPDLGLVFPLPKSSGLGPLLRYVKFLWEVRGRKYDLVIDFFSRGPRSRLITRVTGASRKIGMIDQNRPVNLWINRLVYTDQIVPPGQVARMSDRIPYLLSRIARPSNHVFPHLTVTDANIQAARAFFDRTSPSGKNYWLVFCGSGTDQKNWPADRFAEIARRLVREGMEVFCLGGEMDRPAQKAFARSLGERVPSIHIETQLPWGTLKGVCHLAMGAIGNDSGPLHLAQAVGCPSIVLFGPGDHVSYAPFLGHAVFGSLACQPCQSFANRCPDPQCMTSLSVETVWEAVRSSLKGG